MKRGQFIVIEGADGVGKTTQARLLAETLTTAGGKVLLTSEPTSEATGALIRAILAPSTRQVLNPLGVVANDWRTMALLFAADRNLHAYEIWPALAAGEIVISDRYSLSTLIYQTAKLWQEYARAIDDESRESAYERFLGACSWIRDLQEGLPKPDLTIVLDASSGIISERIEGRMRAGGGDRFERDPELMATVVKLYRDAGRFLPGEPMQIVAAEASSQAVADRVFAAFLRACPES